MARTYLILGHSHTGPLIKALRPEEAEVIHIVNLFFAPDVFDMKTGRMDLGARDWPAADVVCLLVGGNWHNLAGLIESPLPFALGDAEAGAVPADGGRFFVPLDMLRAQAAAQMQTERLVLQALHARFAGAWFVHLCAPPPMADEAHLAAHPGPFAALAPLGFAPRALRRKIYDVQRGVAAGWAAELGASILESPPAAETPDGLLATPFCREDPTHGNAAYGRLVLDRILALDGAPA